jgi:hypothetical protein
MTAHLSQTLAWMFVAPALALFIVAVATLHFMRVKANERLPQSNQLSYFLPMTRWNMVTEAYKRLYPQGRASLIWQMSVLGTSACAGVVILIQIWELVAAN